MILLFFDLSHFSHFSHPFPDPPPLPSQEPDQPGPVPQPTSQAHPVNTAPPSWNSIHHLSLPLGNPGLPQVQRSAKPHRWEGLWDPWANPLGCGYIYIYIWLFLLINLWLYSIICAICIAGRINWHPGLCIVGHLYRWAYTHEFVPILARIRRKEGWMPCWCHRAALLGCSYRRRRLLHFFSTLWASAANRQREPWI